MKECTFHPQVKDKTLANYNSFGFKRKKYSKQSKSFSFVPNLSQSCESFEQIKNNPQPAINDKVIRSIKKSISRTRASYQDKMKRESIHRRGEPMCKAKRKRVYRQNLRANNIPQSNDIDIKPMKKKVKKK